MSGPSSVQDCYAVFFLFCIVPPRFSHHVFWKATFLYLRLVSISTRHAIEHFEQRMTSSSHITRDCLCHRGEQHVVFLLLWELLCGEDHKAKQLITRNVRAWSHSLLEVFISMSRTFSQWKRVNKKCHPKHMMGKSRSHKLEDKKNTTEQSCTLDEPDAFSILCFLSCGSCSVAKTIKPKN